MSYMHKRRFKPLNLLLVLVITTVIMLLLYDIIITGPISMWALEHIFHDTSQLANETQEFVQHYGLF